jgi:N-acetylglucosamine-6-phosphate deacetylase
MQIVGRHYDTGRAVQIEIADGAIRQVRETGDPIGLPWIAPGFVDIQSNGYGGQEFSSLELTPEKVAEIAGRQAAFGVTQFCPTVTTASRETILHAMATIAAACQRWPGVSHTIAGIHLEGPYISAEEGPRGAHPLAHCRPPDWSEFEQFQAAAQGQIRIITLAADYDESPEFIRRAVASGVVAAIGHTSANSEQIRAAVDAGASLSTHLGNGAHRMLRRHPNYLWDQLAEDRLLASLIVDGHHLPPEVVRTFVRAKSVGRCILVSDLSGLAGQPPGRYASELCELEILADGRLVIAGQDQLLAGASQPIGVGVCNVMRYAGVDLARAVEMASTRPAVLIGLKGHGLQSGCNADLTLFDLSPEGSQPTQLRVRATLAAGRTVFSSDAR